jgi:hypothetical protein
VHDVEYTLEHVAENQYSLRRVYHTRSVQRP